MGRVGFRRSCLVRDLALTASRITKRAGWTDEPGAIQRSGGLWKREKPARRPRRLTSRRIKVLRNPPERPTHSTLDTPTPRRYLRTSIARTCTMGSALEGTLMRRSPQQARRMAISPQE
jgi:hypothetical protein